MPRPKFREETPTEGGGKGGNLFHISRIKHILEKFNLNRLTFRTSPRDMPV
ncbi:hypothetical protein JCM17846_16140 [Iodidimonas nitroreducens]|uniref:Uncharacterized protein n=1 Tax=Iodidimonas nitroreducens TaxID=1236968 RepID=A0A5A7N6I2_9PROT|nr:hypothetical protein JCM17846_16140 [Iodidimonas nitroreducens]